jgi:hypothetical protein
MSVPRCFTVCLLSFVASIGLPFSVSASEALLDTLRQYEGRWAGHFTIHSAATGYSQTFPVEQQFWMADAQLHGIAVSDKDTGLESARSVTYVFEDKFVSEITTGDNTVKYIGVVQEGGVLWLPEDFKRANDHQLKETITVEEGKRVLKTDGFDTYVYQEGLGHILFRGSLVYQD